MARIFRSLLYLYPAWYRREFGAEMLAVVEEAERASSRSPWTRVGFWLREIAGLLCGAASERFFSPLLFPDLNSLRRSNMRRFPRTTIVLMIVILAGVALTIENAKVVQTKYQAAPFTVWSTMPGFFTSGFAVMFVLAAAVWAILFALRRTGMHRLSEMRTWEERK